jgi:omega-6 fatty acid desaturase (delta-12 desaturase)
MGPLEPRLDGDALALAQPAESSMSEATDKFAGDWKAIVARYQGSDVRRAIWQVVNTLVPLAAVLYVMYLALGYSYWITLLLAFPAAGLLVRTFIIMHDCAHGSFFRSKRANNIVGWITGVLTVTPFAQWRHSHALHHASSGDLERRGNGDVDTLTLREYASRTRWGRLKYRIVRNPFILFGVGPLHFMITNRIPPKGSAFRDKEAQAVWGTNLALAAAIAAVTVWVGWRVLAFVYFPAMYLAAAGGIWLFYVQHQFEDTYWKDHGKWDYATAAIRGSSYFRLPKVLDWFTGSIGLHHVHHLGPRIPNYRLQQAHDDNPMFHEVTTLTLATSLRTLRLALWDEEREELVSFGEARRRLQLSA